MYRIDIGEGLNLVWQGDTLDWDKNVMIESRLIKRIDGTLEKENFEFKIANKLVKGWAGVFESGSRNDAGLFGNE